MSKHGCGLFPLGRKATSVEGLRTVLRVHAMHDSVQGNLTNIQRTNLPQNLTFKVHKAYLHNAVTVTNSSTQNSTPNSCAGLPHISGNMFSQDFVWGLSFQGAGWLRGLHLSPVCTFAILKKIAQASACKMEGTPKPPFHNSSLYNSLRNF